MSKELKVVYRDFKAKYSVIPNEIVLQPKYSRAKKKADDIKLTRNRVKTSMRTATQTAKKNDCKRI